MKKEDQPIDSQLITEVAYNLHTQAIHFFTYGTGSDLYYGPVKNFLGKVRQENINQEAGYQELASTTVTLKLREETFTTIAQGLSENPQLCLERLIMFLIAEKLENLVRNRFSIDFEDVKLPNTFDLDTFKVEIPALVTTIETIATETNDLF